MRVADQREASQVVECPSRALRGQLLTCHPAAQRVQHLCVDEMGRVERHLALDPSPDFGCTATAEQKV